MIDSGVKAVKGNLADKKGMIVAMRKADFAELNRRQAEAGEELYVNPRNTAAGSLRQKNPEVTASRALHFFAYAWGQSSALPADTQMGVVATFKKWAFQSTR